jgi:hypothetical protein
LLWPSVRAVEATWRMSTVTSTTATGTAMQG